MCCAAHIYLVTTFILILHDIHLVLFVKQHKSCFYGYENVNCGLGIAAKPKNTALLAKPNWRFNSEKSSLWARVLSHKYRPQRRNAHSPLKNASCSPCWAVLRKGKATFYRGTKWIAGSTSRLSFWEDKWLNRGPLRSLISGPLNKGEETIKLVDVGSFFGWNLERISFSFPKQIVLEMKATTFPLLNCGVDRICWQSSPNGDFYFKDAYRLVLEEEHGRSYPLFKGGWVWKVRSIPKVICFLGSAAI